MGTEYKRNHKKRIIGVMLICLLAGMITGCANASNMSDKAEQKKTASAESEEEESKESDEEIIAETIQTADVFWTAGNYKTALKMIHSALGEYPDSHTLYLKKEEYENLLAQQEDQNEEPSDETDPCGITEEDITEEPTRAPFYGIWCIGTKSKSDAEACAENLKNHGYDAQIYVTTDWEKLNSEKWYVVSSGEYETKATAEESLSGVQKVYSNAYVKYTGEYCGD